MDKHRPTRKLAPKYVGPYTISAVISTTAYKLDLPTTMRIHPVFHVSLLKPYHPSPSDFERITPPPAEFIPNTNQEEYEVETILDKRVLRGKTQYLIKWMGYPLHDATWEPTQNLVNAPQKIKEFESTRTLNSKEGRM